MSSWSSSGESSPLVDEEMEFLIESRDTGALSLADRAIIASKHRLQLRDVGGRKLGAGEFAGESLERATYPDRVR